MPRRVSIVLLALLLFSGAAARADLVLKEQTSGSNVTDTVTMEVQDGKMRMDDSDSDGYSFSVIVDLNTRDSITLLPRQKMFLKRSGKDIEAELAAEKEATHGTNDLDRAPAPAVDTGRTAEVGGYDTEIYTWSGANGLAETLWVARNYPDYENIRQELARLDQFDSSGPHRNAQPALSRLPGMVVKLEKAQAGKQITTVLVSAKLEPVDDSRFELPAGYTPWKRPPPPRVTVGPPVPKK